MKHTNAFILFTRVPQAGNVKTRLLPVLSPEQCMGLQTAFLRDLACEISLTEADLWVSFTPEGEEDSLREIFPYARGLITQKGDGLGERMHDALSHVLAQGYDKAVLCGSDLPELKKDLLDEAFASLDKSDVCLGPSVDGGYYLVGLKEPFSPLFLDQSYGHGNVWEQAVEVIQSHKLRLASLAVLSDVDTPEDLRRLNKALRDQDSHTARYLKTLHLETSL